VKGPAPAPPAPPSCAPPPAPPALAPPSLTPPPAPPALLEVDDVVVVTAFVVVPPVGVAASPEEHAPSRSAIAAPEIPTIDRSMKTSGRAAGRASVSR
jgi:hypothetical protein